MTRRGREIETLLLSMLAAVPLYFTNAIGVVPVALFHFVMGATVVRVAMGRGPELLPSRLMRWLALAYVPFYFVDWKFLGGSAIAASTHLVLFIAVSQPAEAMQRENQAQRLLTTALIFVAGVATSTHISILPFIVAFAFVMFRQMMYVSHLETVRSLGHAYAEAPSTRAAALYLAAAALIAAILFPLLPRLRNPLVHGVSGSLPGGATGLSDTINFNEPRVTSPDPAVVSRIWMDSSARAFFTPVRLKGTVYDRYQQGQWEQTLRGLREIPGRGSSFQVGRPVGTEGEAIVQQRPQGGKLFLPVGTWSVAGLEGRLYEGPTRDAYFTYTDGALNLNVRMAYKTEPQRLTHVSTVNYPVTPDVAALARRIVGNELRPDRQAARIEAYLLHNYRYVPNPANLSDRTMSVDDFLLRDRAGHCEYFAAGMVVLLASLDVPARIVGGFYGGRLNPLTGYYTIRREDAHAWTEVWDGSRWVTYDATPPDLRPGAQAADPVREYLAAFGDSLTFLWDRYILTFGLGDQLALFEEMIARARDSVAAVRQGVRRDVAGIQSPLFATLLAIVVVGGAVIALFMRRKRPLFALLARHLAARGIEVGPAMTLEEAMERLRKEQPDAARELEPLVALYEEEQFSNRRERSRAAELRRRLSQLRA